MGYPFATVGVNAPKIDLSFANYVAARKGAAAARTREGAAYAYAGDLKVRQTLSKIRPVTLAVEATVRFWQTVERSRLLGGSVKVTDKQFPALHKLGARCAETLHIAVPTMYVSPNLGGLNAHTFGTSDEAYILLNASLIDQLDETELLDVIGHECGHIQNDHTVYLTTLYFLTRAGGALLRWGAKPAALALKAWARRAEITCDRAGVLCTRDLDASINTMVKLSLGSKKLYSEVKVDEYLEQMAESRGPGAFTEVSSTQLYLPKRVAALRVFAETTTFKSLIKGGTDASAVTGISKEECDARVAEIVAVWK